MRKIGLVLLLVVLSADVVAAQRDRKQDVGACVSVDGTFGPLRCPTSSCGTYYTVQTEDCTIDNECDLLLPISTCCGKYANYVQGGLCLITEMKDPHIRSRIRELARDVEILVPTCDGAYVPARIALRQTHERESGGE